MKLPSGKCLTWKTCFMLALALAKRVSELHGLSCQIRHSKGWRSCTFSCFRLRSQDRTPQYIMPDLKSSPHHLWLTLWMETETKCCSTPSELSRSTLTWLRSIVLHVPVYSSWQWRGRNRCPETPFCFGLDWLPMHTSQQLMMTAEQSRSVCMKFLRLVLRTKLCSSSGVEGRNFVFVDNILSHLLHGCHLLVYGYIFHWF